ncbi:Zn(II)2Cys6 transcription factor domain-containing protein [Aspergillus lucknowensis]|uniref:Zn(2)-C6 fungal-type domain-containing protein n=1 Tax=Aspergillus lucknowensis TaxID=176173 RepID=A0ABR4LT50_9EURO
MPPQTTSPKHTKPRKIRRGHSGCKTCRKRGKRCDEEKPRCGACMRLNLECSYTVDYTFRHHDAASFQPWTRARKASPSACPEGHGATKITQTEPPAAVSAPALFVPSQLDCSGNLEACYWRHFQRHVRHLLPATDLGLLENAIQLPSLRFATLCISASNLSMLDAQVQSRAFANDERKCVYSPKVNRLHHIQAQKYHDQALLSCSSARGEAECELIALLLAHVLLAYYHHASTDYLNFRLAVWECVRFVIRNKTRLLESREGMKSLQMWYRLCMSHRLSKPPAFLLEGEGASTFGPNRFPDSFDEISLACIMGMSTDDLIYDVLIKTIEIRTRMVVFRCVAGSRQISEQSDDISAVAYEVLNKMLGRDSTAAERSEAERGFMKGSNLLGLLDVQKQRLEVWRSRLTEDQLPETASGVMGMGWTFPTHRDGMNALYYILCAMMFEESKVYPTNDRPWADNESSNATLGSLAASACRIAASFDFSTSNTSDIYTFSLAETLLQLVLVWRSDAAFHSIFDAIWPQLERKTKGYEHSHYPTHLVKGIIALIAQYWAEGRSVTYAQPAVPEDIPKLQLLDIDCQIHLVVCGYDGDGKYFIERVPLP